MYNNDSTRVEVTNYEIDEFLNSGEIYAFYGNKELAQVVEEDLDAVLSASQNHYAGIEWGEVTPEDIQELAQLEMASGFHAAEAWGVYGVGAYALQEARQRADRLLMVQASRINEVVNDCIAGVA